MKRIFIASLFISLAGACTGAAPENRTSSKVQSQANGFVTAGDFQRLEGEGWTGSLSYLDYTKGTRESIPVELKFDVAKAQSVTYAVRFPGEAQYNSQEKIRWSSDGTKLDGAQVSSRSVSSNGELKIVTEEDGQDDSRPARIRISYTLAADSFVIRKDVKFSGALEFTNRNEYSLSR